MTLHTRIAVLQPVPVRELFDWVNANLLGVSQEPEVKEETRFDLEHFKATSSHWPDKRDGEQRDVPTNSGKWSISNAPGIGAPAWFWIDYTIEGSLYPEAIYYDENSDETTEVTEELSQPACALTVHFDTQYSYQVEGAGCGDLHAWLIVEIANWLAGRGVGYSWYDEFTGDWHGEDLEALTRRYHPEDPRNDNHFGNPELGRLRKVTDYVSVPHTEGIITTGASDSGYEFLTRN